MFEEEQMISKKLELNGIPVVWLHKRKVTMFAFAFQKVVLGMEYSLTYLTLWLYINQLLDTDAPNLVYSMVSVCYLLSTTVFAPIVGVLVDQSRNTVLFFYLCNGALVFGNLLYALPFSPWCLMGGRLVSGLGGALRSVMAGEVVRSYTEQERNQKLSLMSICFSSGFIFGPTTSQVFQGMDVWLGGWHITTVNAPGVFMAVLSLLMMFITTFCIHNLSKEFDFKAHMENESKTNSINKDERDFDNEKSSLLKEASGTSEVEVDETSEAEHYSWRHILFKLLTNVDTLLIISATFFTMFSIVNFDMWLPLLVVDTMGLGLTEMNVVVLGGGTLASLLLVFTIWRPLSISTMTICNAVSSGGIVTIYASFIIGSQVPNASPQLKAVLAACFMLGLAGGGVIPDVFLVTALANLVRSEVQTFVESVRYAAFALGSMFALLSAAFLFEYIVIAASVYITVIVFLVVAFLLRRNSFINPKIII